MNANNPYEAPKNDVAASTPSRYVSKMIGGIVLVVGATVVAYGATAFWLIRTLPPNGGANGRLPSLFIMLAGMVITVVGLAIVGLRGSAKDNQATEVPKKGIPTGYGILILLAIVIAFFLAVSRL